MQVVPTSSIRWEIRYYPSLDYNEMCDWPSTFIYCMSFKVKNVIE